MCRTKSRKESDLDRGQTGVGASYAVAFTLLIVSGVLAFGYVYVSTPAISATDRTAEASTLNEWLVNDELASDSGSSASMSGVHLNRSSTEDFFQQEGKYEDIDVVADHRVVKNNEVGWEVSLTPRENNGNETVFDGEEQLTVQSEEGGEVPITGVSTHKTPAILDGDVVIVEVNVWVV